MSKIQHLKNAPIKEAVIDIRANLSENFNQENESQIKKQFKDDFIKIEEIWQVQQQLTYDKNTEKPSLKTSPKTFHGYRLISKDGLNVLQIQNAGFTFSRLESYTNWEDVKSNAKKYWDIFKSIKRVENISRLAVRYINKITLPFPNTELKEYFTAPPAIPPNISQYLHHYLTKISIGYPEKKTIANIIQTLDKIEEKRGADILLDIDVFSSQPDFNEEVIWEFFDYLRNIKNQVFFESLTDKTLEMYK